MWVSYLLYKALFDDPLLTILLIKDSIRPSWHKTILDSDMRMGNLSGKGTTRRRVVRPNNQNRPIGHLRPDESPYYGDHRVSWPNDHESVTVMHAIRSQQ